MRRRGVIFCNGDLSALSNRDRLLPQTSGSARWRGRTLPTYFTKRLGAFFQPRKTDVYASPKPAGGPVIGLLNRDGNLKSRLKFLQFEPVSIEYLVEQVGYIGRVNGHKHGVRNHLPIGVVAVLARVQMYVKARVLPDPDRACAFSRASQFPIGERPSESDCSGKPRPVLKKPVDLGLNFLSGILFLSLRKNIWRPFRVYVSGCCGSVPVAIHSVALMVTEAMNRLFRHPGFPREGTA